MGQRSITFARGAAPKAGKPGKSGGIVSDVIGAIAGSGGCGNGTVGGKKGFQPGNKCHQGRNPHVTAAQQKHTAANAVTRQHVRKGTLNTPEGRAAIRTAARAARELRSARETHKAEQKVRYAAAAKERRVAARAKGSTPVAQAESQLAAAHAAANPKKVAARAKAEAKAGGETAHPRAESHDHELVAARMLEKAPGIAPPGSRVRLADLHAAMPDVPKHVFDKAALHLAEKGSASLFRLDNPAEIGPKDRTAVVKTPSGQERHIGYFGGRSSGGDPREPARLAEKLAEHRRATAESAAAPKPDARAEVAKASKEVDAIKAGKAATHLGDIHAGARAGAFDAKVAHGHLDKLARGHTRDELFAAARAAGIEHQASTKKALVEHLKAHVAATAKAPAPAGGSARSFTDVSRPRPGHDARRAIHEGIYREEAKLHEGYVKSLPRAEADALRRYKSGADARGRDAYVAVNDALRAGKTHPLVPKLDAAIERGSVPRDTVVYRGIEDLAHYGFRSQSEAVGAVIHDKAFVSTSLSHYTANTFAGGEFGQNNAIVRLTLPKGARAAYTDPIHNMHENEYVLPRGSRFRITGHGGKTAEGVPILDAELHHEGGVGFAGEPEGAEAPPGADDPRRADRFRWKPGDVTVTRPAEKGGES